MDLAGLFSLSMLAYQVAIILIVIGLILSIRNLKNENPKSLLGLSIVTFLLFIPVWSMIFSSEISFKFFTFSVPAVLLLNIFFHKSKISSFLCLLSTIISLLYITLTKGLMYSLIILGGSFRGPVFEIFSKVNNLEALGLSSWIYYSVCLITILSVLAAFLLYSKQVTKKIISSILISILVIFSIGLVRDELVYKTQITSPSSPKSNININNQVQKIAFLRDNNIWITDSNGTAPYAITNNSEKVMSFALSLDGKYLAYSTGDLDTKDNIYISKKLAIVDTSTKTEKIINPPAINKEPIKKLQWNKDNLLLYGLFTTDSTIVNKYGTNTFGESVYGIKILDASGKLLNKFYGYDLDSAWLNSDLILIDRPQSFAQNAAVYVSKNGTSEPVLIGQGNISLVEASDEVLMREGTQEVVFKNSNGEFTDKGIVYKLYSVNIETKKTGIFNLEKAVYHPAIFSPDLKFYLDIRLDQKNWFLSSVDGKVNIQLPWDNYGTVHVWLPGSQKILYTTKEGLKTIDLNGKVTKITNNSNDKITQTNF